MDIGRMVLQLLGFLDRSGAPSFEFCDSLLRLLDAGARPVLEILLLVKNVKDGRDRRENESPENGGEKRTEDGDNKLPPIRPGTLESSKEILHPSSCIAEFNGASAASWGRHFYQNYAIRTS